MSGGADALIAAEHARRRAIETGDIAALEALVADPFVYLHVTGAVEDRAAYFAKRRAAPHYISATSASDLQVTLRPGHALLRGRSLILTAPDQPFPVTETLFLSAWVAQGDAWRITAYASTPLPGDWQPRGGRDVSPGKQESPCPASPPSPGRS